MKPEFSYGNLQKGLEGMTNLSGTNLNSFSWPEGRSAGMHGVRVKAEEFKEQGAEIYKEV